jgi:hypothetical protein
MGGEDGDSSARIPNPTDYSDGCTQTLDFDSSQLVTANANLHMMRCSQHAHAIPTPSACEVPRPSSSIRTRLDCRFLNDHRRVSNSVFNISSRDGMSSTSVTPVLMLAISFISTKKVDALD